MNPKYKVGDKLVFLKMNAIIRYIGPYHDQPGEWIGLEVDVPKGKNNGTLKGKKYFECEPNHGFFLQYNVFLKALHAPIKDTKPKPSNPVNSNVAPPLSAVVPSRSNDDLNSSSHQRRLSNSVSMAANLNLSPLADNENQNTTANNQPNANSESSPNIASQSNSTTNQTSAKPNQNSSIPSQPNPTTANQKPPISSKSIPPVSNPNQSKTTQQAPIQPKTPANPLKQNQTPVQPKTTQQTSIQSKSDSITSNSTTTNQQTSYKINQATPVQSQSNPTTTNQQTSSKINTVPSNNQTSVSTPQINQNQKPKLNQISESKSTSQLASQEPPTKIVSTSKSSDLTTTQQQPTTSNPEKVKENLTIQCKQEFEKYKTAACKLKELQTRMKSEEETYKSQMKQLEDNFHEQLTKLQLKYLPDQIKLENDLLRYVKNEKIAKKKAMSRYTHRSIELLQDINEEHLKFQNEYRDLIQKQSAKLNSKKKQFNLLEIKLKTQYDTSNEQEKKISELNEKINAYHKELTEKLPVSKESADLQIKITSGQSNLDKLKRMTSIYETDCKIGNELFNSIKDLFGPIVPALNVIYRLIEKVSYLETITKEAIEKSTLEDILHICETALMVLGKNNNKFTDDFQYFIDELNSFEMNIDSEIIPTIDHKHLMTLLQSITPLPLNLALSAHLFRAYMYRLQSSDARDELRNFSKQFNRIFHPCQMLKNREECEKFALIIRSELRKAENKKPFSLMKFLTPLQTLLSYQSKDDYSNNVSSSIPLDLTQNIKMIATEELILANKEKERKTIEEEEQGLPELRRQVADLESTYDQLARYNDILTELTKTIPDEIIRKEEEIEAAEELLQAIEAEKKLK